ncbi:nucleoside-diphosphate-sugar epimerase [Flavobacterium sp. W4I14]|nr:nucleoside-diphosphate-sugar epimerase [Flavobacterium sp. W4I14]
MEKLLLTGGGGFLAKGFINSDLNVLITTLGKKTANNISCDLALEKPIFDQVFDTVVHAAGKAHFHAKTEADKNLFFDVNLQGTKNLLHGLEQSNAIPKSFVFISTVSVYGADSGILLDEDTPLNAKDPYGVSKREAENVVREWCQKNNVVCTIFRLPLLVGLNPPGNLGDMISAIKNGYYFNIGGGIAKKSMVLVDEVVKITPIAAKLGGTYNLTDGYHPSFKELSNHIAQQLGKKNVVNIPYFFAKVMAIIGDFLGDKFPINSIRLKKITQDLTFDDSRARKELNWNPLTVLSNTITDGSG